MTLEEVSERAQLAASALTMLAEYVDETHLLLSDEVSLAHVTETFNRRSVALAATSSFAAALVAVVTRVELPGTLPTADRANGDELRWLLKALTALAGSVDYSLRNQ